MTIKAVLFDKDGTLIDFADTFFDACANIIHLLSQGDRQRAEQLADVVGFDLVTKTCPANSEIVGGTALTIAQLWQPLLGRESITGLSRELDNYFDKYTEAAVTDFEFTKPTLVELASLGIVLGVGTNDSEDNARNHLGSIGIEHLFTFIAGYDSGHGSKPDPGMIKAFSSHAGIEICDIAMVGDSINDLLAGRNAGACAVAVTSGIADYDDLQPFADHLIKDISELPRLLVSKNKRKEAISGSVK
jgi:phosphoglycolate phosphatase